MGEEDKFDRDLQIHLDEKTNDFPATELLPENAVWEARRSLERERRLLQSMIDGARNYPLVYLDRDFNFVRVNEAYAKTCGYKPNELVGKNHFDLYPNEENKAIFTGVRDSGIAVEFHDKLFIFPDQPERGITYWDWTLSPVKDASGNVEGLVFSLFETTERKRAEEALRESEKRFHRLFEEDLTGDFLCTPEGKIILCNTAFVTMFGFSSQKKAVGTSMIELYVQPEERDSMLEALKRQRKLQGYETWRKRRDGELIHVVENLLGHFTDRGELYEIQGYVFDDTKRKQAEEALRQQAQLLHLSYDAILVWRKDGGIEHWNRGAEQLYGFTESEALGRVTHKLLKTIHPVPWLEIEAAMRKHGQWEGELHHFAKNGHEVTVSARHQLVLGTDGIERILETNRDITERKRAEEVLRRSKDELELRVQERTAELKARAEQLSRLSSELTLAEQRERQRIAEILHDHLQQLMVGAKINQEILIMNTDNALKPTAESVLDLISRSIKASRVLTAELSPPVLRSGDLSALLEWLAKWLNENQHFEMNVQTEPWIVLDQKDLTVLLFQSIRELLLNVVKHAGVKSARVEMSYDEKNRLRISVIDKGAGFDPDIIWEKAKDGTGFGLLSIRERITLLGGSLEIKSSPGDGACFSLVVPVENIKNNDKKRIEKNITENQRFRTSAEKIRVLIADDHTVVRRGISTLLYQQSDMEVLGEASDGEEAVHLARQIVPDVILMDISMPNMDGLEATRIIHSEFPHIRVIGLSMYDEDEQAKAMLAAGASTYLSKSGNTNDLLIAIRGEDR
jgi:PAS domain S-box-containing protein